MNAPLVRGPLAALRSFDRQTGQRSGRRRILVDARTPVNFTMIAPVYRAMRRDPRVEFYFTASEEPGRRQAIYWEAPSVRLIHPLGAACMRFDAYVASDDMWATLPRGTCRIQTFHGVGGKYGFDAPTQSMRMWHRLFFPNERRLRNFVKAGAIDPDAPNARLIGLPKTDALVDGTWSRETVLRELRMDPARPTVLYAPTWSPASSLNALGVELVAALLDRRLNVVVKLHDRSRDLRPRYSGGIDWVARLRPVFAGRTGALAFGHDISPYLVAADLMITDHSSDGFEFLLRDRPLVRIHCPELYRAANVHPDYVELMARVAESVETAAQAADAVERGLANPEARRAERQAVAADLFYRAGSATSRAVRNLYEAIELEPAPAVLTAAAPRLATSSIAQEAPCRP
jgi:CDP-Glycerol:Poly(glycerophosphate) glycerophosphotransferase